MGLAAPRKRVKLSHDPNNSKWTSDTGRFGHKIMIAQGWKPGDVLGIKDTSYAELHTAANASHIRVTVKDDNLGLGAKRGGGLADGECTGLDAFQSLLGRLNGKHEDELMKEQKSREDLKRAIYIECRWGSMRFVRGGFLIGDKIQDLDSKEELIQRFAQPSSGTIVETSEGESSQDLKAHVSQVLLAKDRKARRKTQKHRTAQSEPSATPLDQQTGLEDKQNSEQMSSEDTLQSAKPTKPKAKRRQKATNEVSESSITLALDEGEGKGKPGKDNKRQKKQQLQNAIAERERLVEGGTVSDSTYTSNPSFRAPIPETRSNTSQLLLGGRHALRSRNIAQKRLAVLDTASLNQIFMIKQ